VATVQVRVAELVTTRAALRGVRHGRYSLGPPDIVAASSALSTKNALANLDQATPLGFQNRRGRGILLSREHRE
jgi:hypothetical protein